MPLQIRYVSICSSHDHLKEGRELTRIFGVLRTDVIIASVENILIHECCARCHLPEKRDLDWLANLDSLALLHENLTSILASVFAVERGYAILFRVVAFLEGLEGCHKIVSSSNTVRDDTLGDTSGDSTLYNGGDGIHRSNYLGLELWRHVEFNLLE
jgi:hypothetical protein